MLSSHIDLQRTGFVKLLKKYRKWAHSSAMDRQFKSTVLDRPESLVNTNLLPYFEEYKTLLNSVRAVVETTQTKASPALSSKAAGKQPSRDHSLGTSAVVSRAIQRAATSGSDLDFDVALSASPLGDAGSRTTYLVHNDRILELQVMLLQHMCMCTFECSREGSKNSPQSSINPTRRTSSLRIEDGAERDLDCGLVIMDNAADFVARQNSTPISDNESANGRVTAQAAMSIRWTASNKIASVFPGPEIHHKHADIEKPVKVNITHIPAMIGAVEDEVPWLHKGCGDQGDEDPDARQKRLQCLNSFHSWIRRHPNIQPIAGVLSKRSRFMGLQNDFKSGQWCVLDSDVWLTKVRRENLERPNWFQRLQFGAEQFPHAQAVLEVRQEGYVADDIIKLLDESHLVSNQPLIPSCSC